VAWKIKENMDISIIVPIYKGVKYTNQLIKQVEACKKQLINESVELLLLNDDPEVYIQPLHSEWVAIRVFNTEINLGIQGTRVKGYRYCNGEYVLFLDQDDKITDDYLKSQLKIIRQSNAATVVCKAKENGREKYNTMII
jgi:glycosyltransferase involved in cell wall biosynthesis